MAVIDLKNCTFYVYDGKALDAIGIVTFDSAAVDADLLIQAKIMPSPDAPITVTLIDPGTDTSLGVVVTDRAIVVTLEYVTDTVVSTAAEVKTAIEAEAAAHALISVTLETIGDGLVDEAASTEIGTPNSLEITVGEGNLTYSEKRPVEFKKNRGILDEVREADEEPMDVSFEFTFDFLKGTGTGTPTIEDCLKRLGDASAWKNASLAACRPDCVNIAFTNNPSNCAATDDEVTEIYEMYHESLDHDLRGGQVSCAGRANRKVAESIRLAVA